MSSRFGKYKNLITNFKQGFREGFDSVYGYGERGGPEININLGQSGYQASPFNNEGNINLGMKNLFQQKDIQEKSGGGFGKISIGGSKNRIISKIILFLVVAAFIVGFLYFTNTIKSSQTSNNDTAACSNTVTTSSQSCEGVGQCATCNGSKSCNKCGS